MKYNTYVEIKKQFNKLFKQINCKKIYDIERLAENQGHKVL